VGLRKGEWLGLQWSDIDFTHHRLTVRHSLQRLKRVRRGDVVNEGEAKTERHVGQPKGKKLRIINLPKILDEALRCHRLRQTEECARAGPAWKGDGTYVFTSTVGTPLEPRRLDRIFTEICQHAGLRRIRFHDLRHSAAAILIAQKVQSKAIQELLGHSSIQVTLDIYGHLFDSVKQETADKMDEALGWTEPQTTVKNRLVRVK
jgi:integrase